VRPACGFYRGSAGGLLGFWLRFNSWVARLDIYTVSMLTGLRRGLSLVAAAASGYLLVHIGGPILALIPLALGTLLSVAMHSAISRAPAPAWQKNSTARETLAGYGYLAAAIAIPSLVVGIAGLTHAPLVTVASILGASWPMVWGFSIATRLGRRRA
jgi:hypothetical protein